MVLNRRVIKVVLGYIQANIGLVVYHAKLCIQLAVRLIEFLINGTQKWVPMTVRLLVFVILLLPGWIRLLRYYFFDTYIVRNIEYGHGAKSRNLLDLYLPLPVNPTKTRKRQMRKPEGGIPIIVFVSGGAWIIGYKMWSALVGRELARLGYIVVVPDYRNFPQGDITHMIEDIRASLLWTVCNASMFGGDPNKITLSGQSAGAHISLCVLVQLYEEFLSRQQKPQITLNLLQHLPISSTIPNVDKSKSSGRTRSSSRSRSRSNSNLSSIGSGFGIRKEVCSDDDTEDKNNDYETTHEKLPGNLPQERGILVDKYKYAVDMISEGCIDNVENSEHELVISDIKLFIGVSGPYNLINLEKHFHNRGLDASIMNYICANDVEKYSPTVQLAKLAGITKWNTGDYLDVVTSESKRRLSKNISTTSLSSGNLQHMSESTLIPSEKSSPSLHSNSHVSNDATCDHNSNSCNNNIATTLDSVAGLPGFPEVALFHGTKDKSIPTMICTELNEILTLAKSRCGIYLYKHWGHTDAILEGLLEGDTLLVDDMSDVIQSSKSIWGNVEPDHSSSDSYKEEGVANNIKSRMPERNGSAPVMVNQKVLYVAKIVNPF